MRVVILTTDNREHERCYAEPEPRFCTAPQSLFPGFAGIPDLDVHVVSCSKRPLGAPEKLGRNIWYHCLVVPQIGWLRTLYSGCIRASRRKIRELNPDLVHGMGTERDCSISAVLSGYPSVLTVHGNMAELARLYRPRIGSFGWVAARLENFTLPRAAGVLCNSSYTEALVRPRAKKTWRVVHALRPYFLDPPPQPGPRPACVLVAGLISPRKRQLELLNVAEELHRRGLQCEFRFLGFIRSQTDPYVAAFLQRVKAAEAAGYARYVGGPPDSELVRNFDQVAGMVHFPTEESFGNVVCEALARNLKFFGSRLGGMVDTATGVPGAELFDKEDWSGLTNAIAAWVREGHPMPEKAAEVMRQRYSPEAVARRHMEVYREVLSSVS